MEFFSKHKKLAITVSVPDEEKGKGTKPFLAKFKSNEVSGSFETKDQHVIDALKKHHYYNSKGLGSFTGVEIKQPAKDNIQQGVRGATPDATDASVDLKAKFKAYSELKEEIVKVDGDFRKDATEAKVAEYKELEKELGFNA